MLVLVLIWVPFVLSSTSNLDCILDHEQCQILPGTRGNIIRTVMGVSTMEKCLELCETEDPGQGPWMGRRCTAFTHFGAESFPFRDSCILFSSCTQRRPCKGCTTGSSQTECSCSIKYASVIDINNFAHIGTYQDAFVGNELECKRLCLQNGECRVSNLMI